MKNSIIIPGVHRLAKITFNLTSWVILCQTNGQKVDVSEY